MWSTLPPPVTGAVHGSSRSADGKRVHRVRLEAEADGCDCTGFHYRAECRHVASWRRWEQAVIPPGELPT